jgi:hypothetical protein
LHHGDEHDAGPPHARARRSTVATSRSAWYDGLDRRDTKCRTSGVDSGDCLANSSVDFSYVGLNESLADETAAEARRSRSYDYDSDHDRLGVTLQTGDDATPNHRFYAKDANGSVEGLEDANGDVGRQQRYD